VVYSNQNELRNYVNIVESEDFGAKGYRLRSYLASLHRNKMEKIEQESNILKAIILKPTP
jgi:hypothetical protein